MDKIITRFLQKRVYSKLIYLSQKCITAQLTTMLIGIKMTSIFMRIFFLYFCWSGYLCGCTLVLVSKEHILLPKVTAEFVKNTIFYISTCPSL